jgi:hypothetical protein
MGSDINTLKEFLLRIVLPQVPVITTQKNGCGEILVIKILMVIIGEYS